MDKSEYGANTLLYGLDNWIYIRQVELMFDAPGKSPQKQRLMMSRLSYQLRWKGNGSDAVNVLIAFDVSEHTALNWGVVNGAGQQSPIGNVDPANPEWIERPTFLETVRSWFGF